MALRLVKPLHARTILNGQELRKRIWIGKRLVVNIGRWTTSEVVKFEQTWDPEKTTLKRAYFNFTIHGSVPYMIPMPSIEAWLYVNGLEVGHGGWSPWTSCTSRTGTVDVTGFFQNGWNTLEALLKGYFLTVDCTLTVDAEFVFEFVGETPPPPKTEEEKRREEIMRYITYGAIGFGAILFTGLVVVPALKKRS